MLKLTCPACQHQTGLMATLQDNDQRAFLKHIIRDVPTGQHTLMMRYLAMFKPLKNAQSFASLNNRLLAILGMLKSGRVVRNGSTRGAPPELWLDCIQQLVDNKPANLNLPLKSHNYLTQIVFSAAESAAAKAETKVIDQQRNQVRGEQPETPDPELQERDYETGATGLRDLKEFLPNLGEKKCGEKK